MKAYLLLRLKVLGRQLAELGWPRLLLLGPMLLAALRQGLLVLGQNPVGQWVLPFLGAGLCLLAHRQRQDLAFLQGAAPGFRRWLLAEYALWQLPIGAVLLARGAWLAVLVTVGLLPLITRVRGGAKDKLAQIARLL